MLSHPDNREHNRRKEAMVREHRIEKRCQFKLRGGNGGALLSLSKASELQFVGFTEGH